MKSELCRAFVNLSRASIKNRSLLLDPFCGVGGILLEASSMGIRSIGIDIDVKSAMGSLTNIRYFNLDQLSDVITSDSMNIAIRSESIDAIATDPPYGRQTIPRGTSLEDLLEKFIHNSADVLKRNRYMVFATPIEMDSLIEEYCRNAGLKIMEKHLNFVHSSLTRVIYVVFKP